MAFSSLGVYCTPSRDVEPGEMLYAIGVTRTPEPEHDACSGSQTRPGILGGWICSCPCHLSRKGASQP